MPRGTILVVDDSPLTLEVLRQGLEAGGYVVRTASDLADIPRPLRGSGIDLVLLDVEMAEAFGDDLASILRGDGGGGPPIYLLSALEDDELADRAAGAEVDGFIRKRDGVDQVVARVHALLGDAAVAPPSRPSLLPQFRETAMRRTRHARAALGIGDRDNLRQAAYELHALVGEAAVLGYGSLAERAQSGRRAAAACLDAPGPETLRVCAEVLAAIEEEVASMAANEAPRTTPVTGGGGRRVLLIDDSDVYRATLCAILEDSGYAVLEAASVAEARRALDGTPSCQLAIVDVELGDGSGLDLIPALRAAMPGVAVVVMSGGDAMTLTGAADLVLLKTLDPTSVLVKLERLVRERA